MLNLLQRLFFILALIGIMAACAGSGVGRVLEQGIASWYGPNYHGKKTANGEVYNQYALTAAHKTLPFNTYVKVVNLDNGKSVIVRINDRGPYAQGRIIDLSRKAAEKIGMMQSGTAKVRLDLVRGNLNDIKFSQSAGGKEQFTVQVASYNDKPSAEKRAKEVDGWVQGVRVDSKTVYRVYYGKYLQRSDAEHALAQLKKKNISGFVKQVQN